MNRWGFTGEQVLRAGNFLLSESSRETYPEVALGPQRGVTSSDAQIVGGRMEDDSEKSGGQ